MNDMMRPFRPGEKPCWLEERLVSNTKNTVISIEINTLFFLSIQNVLDYCRQFTPFVHQNRQLDTKNEKSVVTFWFK